jgi:transposase
MRTYNQRFQLKFFYDFDGFKFLESWLEDDSIVIELRRTGKTGVCPYCKRRSSNIKDCHVRKVRDLDILSTKVYIEFEEHRINCSCGYVGVESLSFIRKNSRCTKRLEEKVGLFCRVMSIKDVAKEHNLDWTTIKNIDKEYARRTIKDLRYAKPKRIGVDEIAYQKGQKYLTIVRDVDKKCVIWIGYDRKEETLNSFFNHLGERKSRKILVAVIDMWDPYIASILTHTNADIVFDKFHISKKINEALDKVRRKEFAQADKQERMNMKRKRFLILSRNKRLNDEKRETLRDLLSINKNLYSAYVIKEQILDVFDEKNTHTAQKRIDQWIKNVTDSGIEQFTPVIKTLKRYMYGVINYFKHRLTNAASEGFNNKINIIKRRAYGFKDLEYFMLKIYQSCGWKSSH